MKKKMGIVQFPGSNCDRDLFSFVTKKGYFAEFLWHKNSFNESDFEALLLPGGFSYGDYLRAGALAALSPVMTSVKSFAKKGGPVLGICNGFQILTEAGLLPGALIKNQSLRFQDQWVDLEVSSSGTYFGKKLKKTIRLPIAHGQGRFYLPEFDLKLLQDNDQIWLTYLDNPNGSMANIAGVLNREKNVAALMPHPERAIEDWMGSKDGWDFL